MDDQKYETYLCDYEYKNGIWSIDIPATSFEDAYSRLKAIQTSGKIIGVLRDSIPVNAEQESHILKRFLNRLFKL